MAPPPTGQAWQPAAPAWGQPAAPAWGQPPGGLGGPGLPPPPQGNGVAIAAVALGVAALILGAIPFLFFLAIPIGIAAIVCGFIGRSKAQRVGRGKGQSVAGLSTGLLGIVVSIVWIVVIATNADFQQGFMEGLDDPQGVDQDVFALEVGDCFNDPENFGEVDSVPVVSCAEPHDNEVFAAVDYPEEGPFPGEDAILDFAAEQCEGELFTAYVGTPYLDSRYLADSLFPTAQSWEQGDREILCFLNWEEELTGSARGRGD